MTPPKINGQSDAIYNYSQGVCEASEPISKAVPASGPVCSAKQTYSPLRLLQIDLSTRFASLHRNHPLMGASGTSGASVIAALASKGSSAPAKSQFNPAAASLAVWGFGCSTGPEVQEAPADIPNLPIGENPPPKAGEHDGVGGVNSSFATGQCADPAAMFQGYSDNKLLMVCADVAAPGAGLIEAVDPSTGALSSITIPGTIEGDDTRPVTLSAGTSHEATQLIFAGLAPAGSESDFQSQPFIYRNSGIYTVDANGGNPKWTPFKTLVQIQPDGIPENVPLISPEDGANAGVTVSIDPNSPSSMTVDGDTLYVLNTNFDNDQNGAFFQSLAPISIHAFSISPDGLTVKVFGDQRLQANGVDSPGHALILNGQYGHGAIASVGDGRLAVLVRGPNKGNDSRIILLESEDPKVQTQIPLSDVAGMFNASTSNQLPIVMLNDSPHALVGAGDGSGRVAMVNLGTGKVKFIGVFEVPMDEQGNFIKDQDGNIPEADRQNVISIVVDEAGKQAFAVSEQGKVRSINLQDLDGLTGLPTVGEIHTLPADAHVAALRGNSLVVAHPNNYSQFTVNAVPAAQ
jgi:hypothetical protein